ncbi:MAG: hypothetical protein WC593_02725 [Methanoregula sp.]
MHPTLKDTIALGVILWVIGYAILMGLYYSPFASSMSWIIIVVSTPLAILYTWWWFKERDHHPLSYYVIVGLVWVLIALVLDYLFIVFLFGITNYYSPDVLLYYALIFLVPVGVSWYLDWADMVSYPVES